MYNGDPVYPLPIKYVAITIPGPCSLISQCYSHAAIDHNVAQGHGHANSCCSYIYSWYSFTDMPIIL